MNETLRFDAQDLHPDVLDEVLQSLSEYFIPRHRLRLKGVSLGAGGFGTVTLGDLWSGSWMMRFMETPVAVAVKELRAESYEGMELRIAYRLAREMRVWASCKHENVLEFTGYHLSKDFKKAYLMSPYVENGNIRDFLRREPLPAERRLELVVDTIKGLGYLHSREPPIVHGDLKSLNVLVGNEGHALLCDFGLAKALEDQPTQLSTSSGFKGTIRYSSPELLHGGRRDRSSDIWAWACLALEIITGQPPYHKCQSETQVIMMICGQGDTRRTPEPSDLSSLPLALPELLRKCWSFEPTVRPRASACLEESNMVHQLSCLELPSDMYIPRDMIHIMTRIRSGPNVDSNFRVAELSLLGRPPAKVMLKVIWIFDRQRGMNVANKLRAILPLKHEKLANFTNYSISRDSSALYLLFLHQPSDSLFDYVKGSELDVRSRLGLLHDSMEGLSYLHARTPPVTHGALTPWNVIVTEDGIAQLSDITVDAEQTKRKLLSGSNSYALWCSSEVLDDEEVTSKADIWSWACIALQMSLKRPFDGHLFWLEWTNKFRWFSTPSSAAVQTTPEFVFHNAWIEFLKKALTRDIGERPDSHNCLYTIGSVMAEL